MEELTILGCDLMMWLALGLLGLLGPNQQFHNDFFKLFFLGHHGFVPRRTSNKVENKLVRSKVKKQNSANYDFDCSTPLNVMYKSLNFLEIVLEILIIINIRKLNILYTTK